MPREFETDADLTEAVVRSFDAAPDPRLRQIMQSLIRHLHAFASDVQLTMAEWEYAIGFLTRTGQMCDDKRQEFILLSDTLGLSMLVDAINHRMPEGATETTVLGPFYVTGSTERPSGSDISGASEGIALHVSGRVTNAEGAPIVGAWVDVWQADDDGYYDVQKPGGEEELRARFRSNADGRFSFWTIVPTSYPIPTDGPVGQMLLATGRHPYRPAHIHFMIGHEGYETLVTHLFVADDPYLESDAVFGVKSSLIVHFKDRGAGETADGKTADRPWKSLEHRFGLKRTPAT